MGGWVGTWASGAATDRLTHAPALHSPAQRDEGPDVVRWGARRGRGRSAVKSRNIVCEDPLVTFVTPEFALKAAGSPSGYFCWHSERRPWHCH